MPIDLVTACLYGPQGPETKRMWDDKWGKYLEEGFAGKDDEDFIEKTKIIGKHAWLSATVLAIFDVNMFNTRGGVPTVLKRLKYHYVPWLGSTLAYTSTVMTVSALRGGKTDQLNHIAGGFAVGTVLGKFNRSFIGGMVSGIFFAGLGYWYKDSKMRGYELIPAIWDKNPMHGNPFTHKMDFTTGIFPPRPGYWAKSEEDVQKVFERGQMGDGNSYKRMW